MTKAALVTADGQTFVGRSVGAGGVAVGEVVFNTAMTGYQEILSDPSYTGQVVVMTMPHIGNYGVTSYDDQSAKPAARGLVARSISRRQSNWRADGSLSTYLRDAGVVAIADLDTRKLTRHVRDRGAMPVAIGVDVDMVELAEMASSSPSMLGQELASGVSTTKAYDVAAIGESLGRVVAVDFGMKRDIHRQLAARGLDVTVVPAKTSAADILALEPSGVFLSNGPGDPEPLVAPIEALRGVLGKVPVFGICLGHQILGLALGASTFKLPFGHHGANHPVKRLSDGSISITSQNHGFAVDLWSLTGDLRPTTGGLAGPELLPGEVEGRFGIIRSTHQNLNDGTLEGMSCVDIPAFSVQYHPEAAPGPRDALQLFDEFVELMDLEGPRT